MGRAEEDNWMLCLIISLFHRNVLLIILRVRIILCPAEDRSPKYARNCKFTIFKIKWRVRRWWPSKDFSDLTSKLVLYREQSRETFVLTCGWVRQQIWGMLMINLKFQSSGESSKIQTSLYEERYWFCIYACRQVSINQLSVVLILAKLVWVISFFLLRCEIAGGIWRSPSLECDLG